MCLNKRFLVVCLIVYAMFQFYQAFSSFIFVFFESSEYYGADIRALTRFQIIGLITSSICLIIGALKPKVNLLIAGLCYLLYKVGFILWHFKAFYEITLDCRDTNQSSCDPNRLKVIYQHILISGEYIVRRGEISSSRMAVSEFSQVDLELCSAPASFNRKCLI